MYAVKCFCLCEEDGASTGGGSELNSWGWISNPLEFIYAVNFAIACVESGSELNSWGWIAHH